jgi:hypothetical protein
MPPRKWLYLAIACLAAFGVGLLLNRLWPAQPRAVPTPISAAGPTAPRTAAASPTPRPTPITLMVAELPQPSTPATVPTPTYAIPQVGDSRFQRMLARQAGYQTYRFTTVSRYRGDSVAVPPTDEGLLAARVEGEYDHGNMHQTIYQDEETILESIMVGDVAYNRMPRQDETWTAARLSPAEAAYHRLNPFILLLGDGSQLKPLGPDQLPDVPVSTAKYEIAIPPELAATFVAQVVGAESADSSSPQTQALAEMLAAQHTMLAWIGADDNLYRVDVFLHLQEPALDGETAAPGEMTIELSTTYRDFDDPSIRVEPPEGVSWR